MAIVALAAGFGFGVRAGVVGEEEFVYNPLTDRYELRSAGVPDLSVPSSMSQQEYLDYTLRKSMAAYFRAKNEEEFAAKDSTGGKKGVLPALVGYNFSLGPAEKIFGSGGVKLTPRGSVNTKIGVTMTSMGDPSLTEQQRNHTSFDFDPEIELSATASIGEKMSFELNYNTNSTLAFDSKKLKLEYLGKEDEIVKVLAAGNVSMNTSNSLIRGGQSLFGIKTQLQFGKLTVDAVVSQQESQARTTASKGSVQTTPFEISVDNFDENQHFFFNHYFYEGYDEAMATLPLIRSGVSITRLEVWVTNRRSNYDEARNIVAFAALGENQAGDKYELPHNRANTLYEQLTGAWAGARNISQVSSVMENAGMKNGQDYEKIENARKLSPSDYIYNKQLGYISLRMPLQPDEVLAVAYEYTHNNKVYQVGEFGTDNSDKPGETLYLKLVKGTSHAPELPTWKLMMRNVYTVGNHGSIEREKFRLDIKYQNDSSGMYLNYITEGAIANQLLLRVENLDRLDAHQEQRPDGYFDFVEGFTVQAQVGKIIFPSVQPFGEYLSRQIGNPAIADKYVYQELYDSTLTIARQTAEKNKFILTGEYKGSGGGIALQGGIIPPGSVTVTANGTRLQENTDYTIDYATGDITIINPLYENANIETSFEDRMSMGMQRKTMMGINLNYAFTPQFNLGATLMNLSEMPTEMKTAPGQESINNTLFGFNGNFSTQWQELTDLFDKLPLLHLTAPSQITVSAEYAQLIAGHYKNEYGGDYSYIDDFESARRTIDLRSPHPWFLSSTPSSPLFPESKLVNNIEYGKNRALLAWYTIDGLFTRKSTLTPTHIKNDLDQLSNHYVREIREEELYPNKNVRYDEASTLPVLNLAYYPQERGPYNLDTDMDGNGLLNSPSKRWGGIFRKIESSQTDFEKDNVETIEFWLLDPFIYDANASGGDLYINLGDISEDILKDDKKFFENGLPMDGDASKVDSTAWGRVPKQQSLVYAFDTQGDRKRQDVGLNGLSTDEERTFPAYADYLEKLRSQLTPDAFQTINNDPAADNYHYYRGSDYDNAQTSILERYKHYNGTEGNSVSSDDSPESYSTAAKISPDVEDINQDNTLSESEKYYQYVVHLKPGQLKVGENYITDMRETSPTLKNGKSEKVKWYQFKIPVREGEPVGGIRDFQSIRFVRMFMTGFDKATVLRFGTLELVRGDWRAYTKDLSNPTMPPSGNATISVSTVSIEENGDKSPVNYIMPPGVNRVTDPGQAQAVLQNEQSLALTINNLSPGDARAVYKTTNLDTRQYRRLQMFVHANLPENQPSGLQDDNLYVFLRLGSDYKNNYYEYEIPLKLTKPGNNYNSNSNSDREAVWPIGNTFDFPFEVLTNLKLSRNREKRQAGSTVSYVTPYSEPEPLKPMNKITVLGNPSLSEIKVIMIGVRNNSGEAASAEVWVDEMRLTEFNEDGGWAGNVNAYFALSDLGSVNFTGRKQTTGFGSLDQGVMERNLDDMQDYSVAAQVEFGKFFPEKAKVSVPVSYSYRKETISPKYNPLDQDVLLQDALNEAGSEAERDSITNLAVDLNTNRSFAVNGLRVGVASKHPMPYDPANFSFSYSFAENFIRNSSTEYDRQTSQQFLASYNYVPVFKPLGKIQFGYLPQSIAFNSDINRQYYELQLRDLGGLGNNNIPVSFREDFYWRRTAAIAWNLTRNLNFTLSTGTNARIDAPHVQVNKQLQMDDYALWKDSVQKSIRDFGTPMEFAQQFTANYALPFSAIPVLDFISGTAMYRADYDWHRGASLLEDVELGNQISNEMTFGAENVTLNFLNLYNKVPFLAAANKRYGAVTRNSRTTNRRKAAADSTKGKNKAENDGLWYKTAQVLARGLMLVRNVSFSYTRTQGMMLPSFQPEIGDFFGQSPATPLGKAPGWEFAFGLTGEHYLDKAAANGWLINNKEYSVTPAIFNQAETFRMTALVEPIAGLRINLNADRQKTDRSDIYYMYDGSPKRFSGNFSMTTVGLLGGDADKAFDKFLSNRDIITARLEEQYTGIDPLDGNKAPVAKNSSDVLIPSFLAAYTTGGNADRMSLDFFPSLLRLLPNWTISYDGLMRAPFMQAAFKSFALNHTYKSSYAVGAFNSFTNWVDAGNGLGFVENVTTSQYMPSSPYDVTAVSLTEAFDPLIGFNSTLQNNMTLKLAYKTSRNVNLNVSSYQIVEMSSTDITAGLGFRIDDFNQILRLAKTGGDKFNNDLRVSADISFRKMQSLIRKIQDAVTQPVSGDQQTVIKCTADYTMSRMIIMQAYFDKQISTPLVSSTAYPMTKTSFGINVKISLGR